MKKLASLVFKLSVVVALISGCSSSSTSTPNSNDSNTTTPNTSENKTEKPQREKKIVYALPSEPETLDPTLNNYSRSSIVLQNLFRGLYKIDQSGLPVPALAKETIIDETGTKYTFKIDPNAKWSDGKPVTAHDFEYAWKRVLNKDVASRAAADLYYVKNGLAYNEGKASADDVGVKAVDDQTLEVVLENPTTYFLNLLCATSYHPVRKDVVEGNEGWTKSPDTYLSTGPFMLAEIHPKQKYVLKKNPNYLLADKVQIDTLEIVFIETAEGELAAYTNNEIDVSDNINNESMQKYKDTPEYFAAARIGTYYFDFNTSKKPFDDPRVRKALAISINREQIVRNVMQSTEKVAFGFVPYGMPHLVETNKEYRDVVGDLFKEDVAEAKRLLAEAGYPDGKGFPQVDFMTLSGQTDKDIAQALHSMWKENLGVEISIRTLESKIYWDEMEQGNFEIGRDGWTGDYLDPMTNLHLFETVNAADGSRWSNKEYDALLKENREIQDQAKRSANYAKAEQILMDEMPIFPLYFYEDSYLVKPHIKGVMKNFIGHTIFEYASVE
ncbi:peptide ABC transporter substrate-binding protein [Brevibacillus ruminantium]|uniref:Peptide ABC transporter substrate-binding protein n=1 Tax=Brevibacillus ruminantium TaxID=2950604 RepID=A0ABY4WPR7_9BACL|nr:peptide ABC transporter substrate-binding protein [Brevibacillus ruminantium]USG67399.1 peptide ABC transporter substrate-binding protein [Brevibacillus ruminantium]